MYAHSPSSLTLGLSLTRLSTDQIAAAIEGFFWPKIFWDFLTKNLDGAVKPLPILQAINLAFGIVMLCWEWPLGFLAGTAMHRSIEARLVILPMAALAAALMYQTTNPAIYYTIALAVYFWAYSEGEVLFHQLLVMCDFFTDISIRSWSRHLGHCPSDLDLGRYRHRTVEGISDAMEIPERLTRWETNIGI